jgi:hypothetical protein
MDKKEKNLNALDHFIHVILAILIGPLAALGADAIGIETFTSLMIGCGVSIIIISDAVIDQIRRSQFSFLQEECIKLGQAKKKK